MRCAFCGRRLLHLGSTAGVRALRAFCGRRCRPSAISFVGWSGRDHRHAVALTEQRCSELTL